ncbi:MAG: DUF1810 domain-containing protein [Bacteroidales bacterium]|nr:DUF1810 domain-containing protein [Bacteroidales bacterium]
MKDMEDKFNLERFVEAQDTEPLGDYQQALAEMRAGEKRGHWIWYIFPQMKGLGRSPNSDFFGISGLEEAKAYLAHEVLGPRLREITEAVLENEGEPIDVLMGWEVDAMKLKSSMTLFDAASPNDIFGDVLEMFFDGQRCWKTRSMI